MEGFKLAIRDDTKSMAQMVPYSTFMNLESKRFLGRIAPLGNFFSTRTRPPHTEQSLSMMKIALTLTTLLSINLTYGDWPQFLGPQRNGCSQEKIPLLDALPNEDLRRLWSVKAGAGFASPVIGGKRCLIFHRVENAVRLDCLDAATGEPEWHFEYPATYVDQFGFQPGPRSTPAIADGRVFLHGAEGKLHALDLDTGKVLWKHDLAKVYGSPSGFFGRSSSPLVQGKAVMLDIGGRHEGKPANLVAFNAQTGELLWQAGDGEADYASGNLLEGDLQHVAVFFTRAGFTGVDTRTGKVLFQEPFRSEIHSSVNAASPVMHGNAFFLSSCYDVGAGVWQVGNDGQLTNLYKRQGVLDCHFATPVFHEDHLYGFHGRQERGQELRCVKWATGDVQWRSDTMAAGTVSFADGKLLIVTEKGELIVAEASSKAFKILFRTQVSGFETRAYPALANGILYVRDKQRLHALDLRQIK